jgi:hypothetical protein
MREPWYESESEPRWMGGIAKWVLYAVALALLVSGVLLAVNYFTADTRGKVSARNQTNGNGTYRIAQYDHFYDLCGSVQALEDQRDTMKADTSLPKDQRAVNVLALTNQRNTLIRRYNADSSKVATASQFKASDLPPLLNPHQEHTQCTP